MTSQAKWALCGSLAILAIGFAGSHVPERRMSYADLPGGPVVGDLRTQTRTIAGPSGANLWWCNARGVPYPRDWQYTASDHETTPCTVWACGSGEYRTAPCEYDAGRAP